MADEESSDNATVQMSAEQIKRLHAQLAAGRAAAKAAPEPAPEPAYEEPTAEPEPVYEEEPTAEPVYEEEPTAEPEPVYEEEPAAAPVPPPEAAPKKAAKPDKAPKPEKAAKPAKPAPKPAVERPAGQGGGGLLIVGGIGAIIAGLSICLPVISSFQGMVGEAWPIIGGAIGMVIGHLLVGLGMFGAVSRTNGVAALVGMLHLIAMAGLTFYLLLLFRVFEVDGDIVRYVALAPGLLPGTAWLLSGIWGFAAGAGALGVLHGVFSFLGGAAAIGLQVGALAGAFGGQDDAAIALALGAPGAVLIGTIFLAILFFGRLRRTAG